MSGHVGSQPPSPQSPHLKPDRRSWAQTLHSLRVCRALRDTRRLGASSSLCGGAAGGQGQLRAPAVVRVGRAACREPATWPPVPVQAAAGCSHAWPSPVSPSSPVCHPGSRGLWWRQHFPGGWEEEPAQSQRPPPRPPVQLGWLCGPATLLCPNLAGGARGAGAGPPTSDTCSRPSPPGLPPWALAEFLRRACAEHKVGLALCTEGSLKNLVVRKALQVPVSFLPS